jgi:hypothetical protein
METVDRREVMEWTQVATIAGLIVVLFGWLKLDIRDLRVEMRTGFDRVVELGQRVARIEGHLGIGNTEAWNTEA